MFSRRDAMLRLGQLGLGTLSLPNLLARERALARTAQAAGKAKSCIYIFLWGGPPQLDLWDMKPEAPKEIRSPFQPIHTKVPGIDIVELMPLLAQQTDKVAIVRSVTHRSDVHGDSIYHMLTGRKYARPSDAIPRQRSDFPSCASVVSNFSNKGILPATVTLPRTLGIHGAKHAGTYAGFLGMRHDPLELGFANVEEPNQMALTLPAQVDLARLQARVGLLKQIEETQRSLDLEQAANGMDDVRAQAIQLLSSPAAKHAFNLEREPLHVRERYGNNEYGESFLLARRLVEAGVRLVSVIWMQHTAKGFINSWDIHQVPALKDLKDQFHVPPLDRAYAALLADLTDRGLLDETLVVVVGEFGRTPLINKTGGRDHWGACQSALLAGGGIRGGKVYGASDRHAAYVKEKPVAPEDLVATIYHAFGLEEEQEIKDFEGRPHRITEGKPLLPLFA
jgi:hypothetical protein